MESFSIESLIPGIVSLLAAVTLVMTKEWHGKFSSDSAVGVQKFHTSPTPRVGGVAIALGLVSAWLLLPQHGGILFGPMLLAGLPAFIAGLAEDITKKVGVRERLFATMTSGMLACTLTGYSLSHVGLSGLDSFLSILPLSMAFTAFAVAGVANSVNIIDGFNGLAGGTLVICFSVLGLIAGNAGDAELARISFTLAAVTAGFLVVNFPFGKIFLGDGGAYLLGFLMAWVAVMLPMRNPSVSVWASLLVCSYPVIETLFSILRRAAEKNDPGQPDSHHLHSMIKKRVVRRFFMHLPQTMRNSLVSPFCWTFALVPAAYAYNFSTRTDMLIAGCAFVFALYINIYQYLGWRMEEIVIQDKPDTDEVSTVPAVNVPAVAVAATVVESKKEYQPVFENNIEYKESFSVAGMSGVPRVKRHIKRSAPSFQPVMASAKAVAVEEPVVTEYYFKQLGNPSEEEFESADINGSSGIPSDFIPSLHILIAEDDKVSSLVLKSILKGMNITIFHADNGREAVELVRRHPELNIVLMDIKMPQMDGFEATRLIREINPDLPVIAQSAYDSKQFRDEAKNVGCDAFISKPIRKEELLEAIQVQLNR